MIFKVKSKKGVGGVGEQGVGEQGAPEMGRKKLKNHI
jgi:hypothetical protein